MNDSHLDARLLIVDDERSNVILLERILERAGYTNLQSTTDPREIDDLMTAAEPDLLLLDLQMPYMDGYEVMERLKGGVPDALGRFLPIVVLTADVTREARERSLSLGANDFVTKPFDTMEVVLRIGNLLEMKFLHDRLRSHNRTLDDEVRVRTHELSETVDRLREAERELSLAQEETVRRLSIAAEYRDDDTARHIVRMSEYCALLARRVGWDDDDVKSLRIASQMHDIGKIGTPDSVLLKPGRLTDEERSVMEQHAEVGHRILKDSTSALLQLAAWIALTHHERYDGTGYPNRCAGDEIPLESRVAAIADVFDALSSDRVYRPAFPIDTVVEMMREGAGSHFDPDLLTAFLDDLDEVLAIKESHRDEDATVPRPGTN